MSKASRTRVARKQVGAPPAAPDAPAANGAAAAQLRFEFAKLQQVNAALLDRCVHLAGQNDAIKQQLGELLRENAELKKAKAA